MAKKKDKDGKALWQRSSGGPRPSVADYVRVRGPADRAPAAGGC